MCITGHIYKIIHLDSEIQYIGSTCDSISGRWRTHKNSYKNWLSNKEKYSAVAIYPYFEQYSIDRFKMILINSYEVYDKTQLKVYEQLAINRTKCVNTIAAMQLIGTACMSKHYYQSISEQKKLYRQQNKQKISEQKKIKITCECGAQSTKSNLTRHRKTQKHLTALAALSF